jgi:hypothetical protein
MSNINATLDLVKQAQGKPSDEIAKAAGFLQSASATSGLTAYSLEAPAKTIYPVLTPLRNTIPRVTGGAGIQANWRAITGINTANARLGVSEGNRGAAITHTTADYLAAFRGFGLEDYVTFEAQYAAEGFDDARARAVEGLLRAVMIGEEALILGGNNGLALGTTPTPTLTLDTETTSTTTNGSLTVQCVALGFNAYWALAGFNNGATGQAIDLTTADPNAVAVITKTNTDASSDTYNGGVAKISLASAAVTIDASHKGATASVTPVPGAFGYAWYAAPNGGTMYLAGITTVAKFKVAADPSTTTAVGANLAADKSKCALEFDGLLTQALTANSGAYTKAFAAGAQLTTDGAGGCTELNAMFQDRWNLYRLSPDELWMNAQQLLDLNALIIKNGGAPLIRFGLDANAPTIDAGVAIGTILNKITNTKVAVKVHPNMPPGAIFARCTSLPYKLSGISEIVRMLLRQDYYQLEWPRKTRKYEYGVYFDGVLQDYFPPSLGVLYNITQGIA